jgi:hypothetical protein
MPRKKLGKHTSPESAGEENMTPEVIEKFRCDYITADIMRKTAILKENRQEYNGQWTDEQFQESIDNFFQFCANTEIEPSRPLLQFSDSQHSYDEFSA